MPRAIVLYQFRPSVRLSVCLYLKQCILFGRGSTLVFTARRYESEAVRRGFAIIRCLSVRLSVTLVDCIHAAEDIVKLLARPGSPITLV